jgi:hypothetical protein
MIQVLLSGTGPYQGDTLTIWVPRGAVGETVRWNGSPWTITARYGTTFSPGLETRVARRERPRDESLLEN